MDVVDRLPGRLAADLDGAFPDLVRETAPGLWRGVAALTGDPVGAEDVVQETFVRAHRALGGWPPERIREVRLRPWLWTIARNEVRNRSRAAARRPLEDPLDAAGSIAEASAGGDGVDPVRAAERADDRRRLAAALASVPEAQARAVVLRHLVGLAPSEIAALTDRPVGTVKSDVHRGLAALRAVLAGPAVAAPAGAPAVGDGAVGTHERQSGDRAPDDEEAPVAETDGAREGEGPGTGPRHRAEQGSGS